MFFNRLTIRNRNFRSKMSLIRNCHNLCAVLRDCLAEEPSIDALEERTVSVRCVDEDQNLYINTKIDGKPKHYTRKKCEALKNTLSRIQISLAHPKKKKRLRKKDKQYLNEIGQSLDEEGHKYPDDVTVEIKGLKERNHFVIAEDTSNVDAWKNENVLVVGDEEFIIRVNAPTVTSVTLPESSMSGFPIIPNLELEFAKRESSKFMWFRKKQEKVDPDSMSRNIKDASVKCCDRNVVWEFVSDHFMFTPSNKDIGYQLKFLCVPKRGEFFGFSHEAVSSFLVEAGPGVCVFDERHLFTCNKLSEEDQFRVLSYNILADVYCTTDFARTHLYPYCSSYALNFSYRGQLILKELIGYNADIVCLQECDQKVFNNFLQPALKDEGFEGHYMRKAGEMPEGEALFYRRERFSLIKEACMIIKEAIELDCNKEILNALENCPERLANLKKRTSVGQILALRDNINRDRAICILNTHLFFRPEATDIRLLQMSILLNCLQNFVTDIREAQGDVNDSKVSRVAILLCGDFNSTPDKAVIEYLLKGVVPADHEVWSSGNPNEKMSKDLRHDFKLFSACGFPKFTNYVAGFKDTLDYIIPDTSHFTVEACVPFPDEDVLSLHTALPSVTAPSDHLALICDLAWTT